MKSYLLALIIVLSFSGNVFASEDAAECGNHKVPSTDVTAADEALAKQAAQSMMDQDRARPDGKITPEMRKSLEKDSANITKSLSAAKTNASCCENKAKECCKGAGKACCAKATRLSASGALDGSTTTMQGKCPDKK